MVKPVVEFRFPLPVSQPVGNSKVLLCTILGGEAAAYSRSGDNYYEQIRTWPLQEYFSCSKAKTLNQKQLNQKGTHTQV